MAASGLIGQTQTTLRYRITDLGTLGGAASEASGLNLLGDVVGSSLTSAGVQHGFLYRNGRMVDLGVLNGGTTSRATSISDTGVVVGYSGINAYGPQLQEFTQGFVWQDGSIRGLGALYCPCSFNERYGTSRAFAVSRDGRVVGESLTGRARSTQAFLWQENAMRGLIEPDGLSNSAAYDINDLDEIVGEFAGRAFLAARSGPQDLGVLPGDAASSARAVSNTGVVAGDSLTADGVSHAFVWDLGTMRALGTLAGDVASQARAINAAGQIAGRSGTADFSRSRAVLWQDGAVLDLNSMVDAAGWTLSDATGINDVGQVVGVGLRDGLVRAFRLDPQ